MPNAVQVSVVIVNWNRRADVRDCLASLTRQSFREFETIVVDNGSTDGSLEVLRDFESLQPRVVANRENRGFCAANNQGIKISRGRWTALLNNDAEAEPGWLEEMLRVGESDPRVGMVACKILARDDLSVIDKVGHVIYPDGQNRGRGSGRRDDGAYDQVDEVAWPDGCAALYRREMLDEIGLFDEDFFAYADDAELGLRGRIAGWICRYAPRAVVRHRLGSTLGRHSARRLFLIERNRVWLAAKLFPKRLWPGVPFYFLLRAAAGALALGRGRGETAKAAEALGVLGLIKCLIQADWAALKGLPVMLRKRRRVRRRLDGAQTAELLKRFRARLSDFVDPAV